MHSTVTAMDLGTSNTCITQCDQDNNGGKVTVLRPHGWHHSALGGAIPTLVLYKDNHALSIGAAAEHEFGEATQAERAHYTLASQFKPDIAASDTARTAMEDFLRLLRQRVTLTETLLVGIPSQAENHFQQALRQCLHQAQWPQARFLREPMGAIIHYIATGVLPPSQAAQGVLTVDFGGGTCDLALVRRAHVVARHGDMLYGGRLFDDLFYQILLQRHPHLQRQLLQQGNAYYVHWLACRRAKEDFSTAMQKDRHNPYTLRVRWSHWDGTQVQECAVYIENLTWDEFLTRAGDYTASPDLLHMVQHHAPRAGLSSYAQGLLQGKRVDLISWFEDIFLTALQHRPSEKGEHSIPTVLLTGGSSAWPFVEDIVRQSLGHKSRILIGDEPYADIAKGLAQYHMLSERLNQGQEQLHNELASFMEQRIRRKAIHTTLKTRVQYFMKEWEDFLRRVILLPEFRRYREAGGSIQDLMQCIATSMEREAPHTRLLLEDALRRVGQRVAEACRAELKTWFQEKGIPIMPERLEHSWLGVEMDSFLARMSTHLSATTLVQGRTIAAMGTMLTGSSLAALAVSATPLASLAVGLGGIIIMKIFKWDTWLVNQSLRLPVPGLVRRRLFDDARLDKLCQEQLGAFAVHCEEQLLQEWEQVEEQILAEAGRIAREEIAALDILNITTC